MATTPSKSPRCARTNRVSLGSGPVASMPAWRAWRTAGSIRQDLGMTGVVEPARVQSLLLQRRGHDAVGLPGQGQIDRGDQEVVGRPARRRTDASGGDAGQILFAAGQTGDAIRLREGFS